MTKYDSNRPRPLWNLAFSVTFLFTDKNQKGLSEGPTKYLNFNLVLY